MHARWAMLGVAGVIAVEVAGQGDWVSAQPTTWDGTAKYLGNETHAPLFAVIGLNTLLMAFAESQRGAASAEERLYPGGKFDPMGMSKGKDFETLKRKELANGRVAMMAFFGVMAQHQAAGPGGPGPVAALLAHIADPWHVNVGTNAAAIPWLSTAGAPLGFWCVFEPFSPRRARPTRRPRRRFPAARTLTDPRSSSHSSQSDDVAFSLVAF